MAGTGVDTREVITDKTALFQSFCPIRKKKAEFQVITTQGNTGIWEQGVCVWEGHTWAGPGGQQAVSQQIKPEEQDEMNWEGTWSTGSVEEGWEGGKPVKHEASRHYTVDVRGVAWTAEWRVEVGMGRSGWNRKHIARTQRLSALVWAAG